MLRLRFEHAKGAAIRDEALEHSENIFCEIGLCASYLNPLLKPRASLVLVTAIGIECAAETPLSALLVAQLKVFEGVLFLPPISA